MLTSSRRSLLKKFSIITSTLTLQGCSNRPSTKSLVKSSGKKSLNMDQLRKDIQGVHCFMVTPFLKNGQLDHEGLSRNIALHAKAEAENMTIVVGGGMGEIFSLNMEEHRKMAKAAVSGAQGKLPVVVGACGGYSTAKQMAQNAQLAGADAILLFAPPYWSWIPEYDGGIIRYFKDIIESIDIGVVLATVSGHKFPTGGEKYWPYVLKKLADLPNVIGFEDSSGGISMGKSLGSLVEERLVWVARGEGHALHALPVGAKATTSAVATFVPKACREFWQQGILGRGKQMKNILDSRINTMAKVRSVKPGYHVSGIKVALEFLGRAGGPVRLPLRPVLSEDRLKIGDITKTHAEI